MRKPIFAAFAAAVILMPGAALAQGADSVGLTFQGVIPPRGAEDWRTLARAQIDSQKLDQAIASYERLLELAPGDSEALAYLAEHDDRSSFEDERSTQQSAEADRAGSQLAEY